MDTYQIAPTVLENYRRDKLSDERIDFLKNQANEQLEEIAQNEALYQQLLEKVKAPQKIDTIILWMLLMLDEDIVEIYIDEFSKPYREIIPAGDLADLLLYVVHLKKVENIEVDGFDYLLAYQHDGKDQMDQYCVTNVLLYIQKSKEIEIQF